MKPNEYNLREAIKLRNSLSAKELEELRRQNGHHYQRSFSGSPEDVVTYQVEGIKFLKELSIMDDKLISMSGLFNGRVDVVDNLNVLPMLLPMFWKDGPAQIVTEASKTYPIDRPIVPPDKEHHGCFIAFSSPQLFADIEGEHLPFSALSFSLGYMAHGRLANKMPIGWQFIAWTFSMGKCIPVFTTFIEEGKAIFDNTTLDENLKSDPTFLAERQAVVAWCGAAMRFLEQKLIIQDDAPLSRPIRKRLGLEYPKLVNGIKVVRMRHIKGSAISSDGTPVEWSHRWMVRGHWRDQWHQRTQSHVPTWILPHIKGPEDKPLKTPGVEVWDVCR